MDSLRVLAFGWSKLVYEHSGFDQTAVMPNPILTATYQSPSSEKTFSKDLPPLSSDEKQQTVEQKTEYLSALRSSIGLLQGDVNAFLTQKMDDEKAVEAGKSNAKQKTKEEREEEMYGEEDPDDES